MAEVEITLTVPEYPLAADLYFWALQATFAGPDGIAGGAHLGLQWHKGHPGGTAVNWGGYGKDGAILVGTDSHLLSTMDNPHTRDYGWRSGSPYRLRIASDPERGPGWWAGSVVDLERDVRCYVRSLFAPSVWLTACVVWTEAFCRCDAPPVAAIWSSPFGRRAGGDGFRPEAVQLSYQSERDGGCSNTDSYALPHGVAQVTGVTRTNSAGSVLRWPDVSQSSVY